MKKLFVLMMILAFALQSNAQYVVDNEPWCPPGATWIYRFFSTMSREYMKFEYVKDTIVEQENVKKLDRYNIRYIGPGLPPDNGARIVGFLGSEYMYESNDSIFWYDGGIGDFRFIYMFNASVGDQFILGNSRAICPDNNQYSTSDTLTITNQYIDTFSNRIFSVYSLSYSDSFRLGNIINKIGPLNAPFPEINSSYCPFAVQDNVSYEGFVCYMDDIRGSLEFSYEGGYGDCRGISTSIKNNQKHAFTTYYIYPNPTTNNIKIDIGYKGSLQLELYNYAGQKVKEQREFTGEISVLELPAGIYIVKLTDNNGANGFAKFIKQ